MKKTILQLGKPLTRKEQSEISGGDPTICSGVNGVSAWRLYFSSECNCTLYETMSPGKARTRLRIEPGDEGHYCPNY